ncbi:hypothetical protein HPB48_025453 [Haemaphysalis longicornis]|uniref:Uncharacterized protein n=1 Tax=Haemaphysalis longicornis TaxID=44386 RepID=A0A9J6GZ17_HAELO|nr:hypothetical protein HPB48_025453 [Haemaphysalis longicornis]
MGVVGYHKLRAVCKKAGCERMRTVQYFNNYLLDPKRPQLPEHPANRAGPGAGGGRGGGPGGGVHDGHAMMGGHFHGGGGGFPPPPPFGFGRGDTPAASREAAACGSVEAANVSVGEAIDTTFLSSDELQRLQQQADGKIASLSSASASERKLRTLIAERDAASSETPAATYTVVDLAAINRLLGKAVCRLCGGNVSISRGAQDYGIAVQLRLDCSNCGERDKEWSSSRVAGTAKCNPLRGAGTKASLQPPDDVKQALLPVYERLADKELLLRCHRGKTQNANESLHSVVWSLIPKEKHASLIAVETAVAEAIMRFNAGVRESSRILRELQMQQNCKSVQRAREKDSIRVASSERKRSASASFCARQTRLLCHWAANLTPPFWCLLQVQYFNNYLLDPKRPQLPEHPANRAGPGAGGGRGGGPGGGVHDGHAMMGGHFHGGGGGFPPPPPFGFGRGGHPGGFPGVSDIPQLFNPFVIRAFLKQFKTHVRTRLTPGCLSIINRTEDVHLVSRWKRRSKKQPLN